MNEYYDVAVLCRWLAWQVIISDVRIFAMRILSGS